MPSRNTKHQKGFTLIELAIVLIMFGFVSSAILLALRTYTEQVRIEKTRDAVNNSIAAVQLFINENNGRYPCPSDFNVTEGAANYGFEMIGGLDPTDPVELGQIGVILNNNQQNGRDGDNADADNNPLTGRDQYVVGGIPFMTLLQGDPALLANPFNASGVDSKFSRDNAVDGWNNRLTYAVSRHLCDPDPANPNFGETWGNLDVIIEGTDVGGNPISLLPQGEFAQFVIVSHGENAKGARNTQSGNEIINCVNTVTPPPPGPLDTNTFVGGYASEKNNCNYAGNNGIFISALRNEANDNDYFDDYIKFGYKDDYRIWSSRPAKMEPDLTTPDPLDFIEISRINNVNDGGIAINIDAADEAVHVQGDVLATEIQALAFCDTTTQENCMPAEILAGNEPDMSCINPVTGQASGAVKSIEKNKVTCVNPFASHDYTCPSIENPPSSGVFITTYLRTVRSDGGFTCCDSSATICNTY